jgi:hypothetical protein
MSTHQLPPAIASLADARALLEQLATRGWLITDGLGSISLESEPSADPNGLLSVLDTLGNVSQDGRLLGKRGRATLRLRRRHGELSIDQLPDDTPNELFEDATERRLAEDVWAGSADVAMRLPFEWRAEAEIDLGSLVGSDVGDVRVSMYVSTVEAAFDGTPYWHLRSLVPPVGRRIYIALDAPSEQVDLGAISFAGAETALRMTSSTQLPGSTEPSHELPELPLPTDLLLAAGRTTPDAPGGWSTLVSSLQRSAAAAALCWMSSDLRISGMSPRLTFRGLRSTSIVLAKPPDDAQAILTLFEWTFLEPSPDRLLAVQQVASLQSSDELIASIADIRASAEIVYLGLRSDAVAEAVKGYREAHANALDAARQAVKSVQEMTKASS